MVRSEEELEKNGDFSPLVRIEISKLLMRGLSQGTVADIVGTSQATISRLFKKETKDDLKKVSK